MKLTKGVTFSQMSKTTDKKFIKATNGLTTTSYR